MASVGMMHRLRDRARALKRELGALWLAGRDPRVPWYAKALAVATVAYAVSPIDLVPDFIPVLGLLDDIVLVPLGIALAVRLIPAEVMADLRARAGAAPDRAAGRVAAVVIVCLWLAALAGIVVSGAQWFRVR